MRHFPAFLALKGRRVVVVGKTPQADQRASLAQRAGASVERVANLDDPNLLHGATLLFVATGSLELDTAAAAHGRRSGVAVNVVDRPALCDFVVPAIVDRDPVLVAIGTAGASPALARRIRTWIEAVLPARLGALASFAQRFRPALAVTRDDATSRRRFWDRQLDSSIVEQILAGREAEAMRAMVDVVNRRPASRVQRGSVHLVGAGPGDPDLLTLRALQLLQRADVILHDELVPEPVLDRARRDARRINVGKRNGAAHLDQAEINALMLREVGSGQTVVRLKGGDPYIFGRGGEERDYLQARGVDVFVVPGVTAAQACAASAGIPLTHREYASAVTFVTGHSKDGAEDLDWTSLARAGQTIAVYMGLSNAAEIRRRLLEAGLAPATPVAIIQDGTLPGQRISLGELRNLAALAAAHRGGGPALLIIGKVAALADQAAMPALAQAS